MKGRKPVPTALRIINGNPSRRPLNTQEPQPRKGTPSLPKWLRDFPAAVKEWKREARELSAMGVLTMAEAGDLAMRAYIAAELHALAADIRTEGRVIEVKGLDKGFNEIVLNRKTNPKCVQLKNLMAEYRALGSLLGLDPSSRSRLKTAEVKQPDKVQSFMGRKNGAKG